MGFDNEQLRGVYDSMHKEGPSAWFDDGEKERKAILQIGEPWDGLRVLEIGCGEGDLVAMMTGAGASRVIGIDYSVEAVLKAQKKHRQALVIYGDYRSRTFVEKFDRIVMQGVIEHFDDWRVELAWIMENLLNPGGDVIISCPNHANIRGIIWQTLELVGAVMSKTDLHIIRRWDIFDFCMQRGYSVKCFWTVDHEWGCGRKMADDLTQRIPLALRDGNLKPTIPISMFLENIRDDCGDVVLSGAVSVALIKR